MFFHDILPPLSSPSATGDIDYEAVSVCLTFILPSTTVCTNIRVLNDVIYEDPENFTITLTTSLDIDPDRRIGTAIITDDDRELRMSNSCDESSPPFLHLSLHSLHAEITIGFEEDAYSVSEEDGSVTVCVKVKNNGILERSVVVDLATANGPQRPALSE